MPKLCEILLNLDGYHYYMSLDLCMNYFQILLRNQTQKHVHKYPTLWKVPVKTSTNENQQNPGNFQEKMNKIFRGFKFIQLYIDNLLITTNGDCSDLLENL